MKNITRRVLFLIGTVFLLASCTPPEGREYKHGQDEVAHGRFLASLDFFERAIKRNPESDWAMKAAREGGRISYFEVKDYKRAVNFYRSLVVNSRDSQERIEAQKKLAEIYLENLQDYPQAIAEYSKLVEQNLSDQEVGQDHLSLARAYYYQNNVFQADSEIAQILKLKVEPPLRFSALMLSGNILIAKKEFSLAANLFKDLIKEYPDKALHENVPMTLAVCYEEAGDFKGALSVLEGLRGKYSPAEYIELRIKRLKERQTNQPGVKGFRK
jgi:tetratricopeptide (TPR) repeat protein